MLKKLTHYIGNIDWRWWDESKNALKKYTKAKGISSSDVPTNEIITSLVADFKNTQSNIVTTTVVTPENTANTINVGKNKISFETTSTWCRFLIANKTYEIPNGWTYIIDKQDFKNINQALKDSFSIIPFQALNTDVWLTTNWIYEVTDPLYEKILWEDSIKNYKNTVYSLTWENRLAFSSFVLWNAMDGIGTDKEAIKKVINTYGSPQWFDALISSYNQKTGKSLILDLRDELSQSDIDPLLTRMLSKWSAKLKKDIWDFLNTHTWDGTKMSNIHKFIEDKKLASDSRLIDINKLEA